MIAPRLLVGQAVLVAMTLVAGITAAATHDVPPARATTAPVGAAARPAALAATDGDGIEAPPPMLILGADVPDARPAPGTVAITFDDGPHPWWTPDVLDILDAHGARATFFVLGRQVDQYPELVREIAARGHSVQNHTWNHRDLTTLGEEEFRAEVDDTARRIAELTGLAPSCVRPPEGRSNDDVVAVLEARGMAAVTWTVDTKDWVRPGTDAIIRRLRDVSEGDVIVFHDAGGNRAQTLEALPVLLEQLGRAGLGTSRLCIAPAPLPPPRSDRVDQNAEHSPSEPSGDTEPPAGREHDHRGEPGPDDDESSPLDPVPLPPGLG